MATIIKLYDIVQALDFIGDELKTFLDKRTGKVEIIANDESLCQLI
ncbi:MAG: hypothetical protein ACE5EE_07940 [Fidelibacterota bacterium]